MVLEDYLDISRRRSLTLLPLFKLQLHMLQDLVIAEKTIGTYKLKMKEISGEASPSQDEDETDGEPEDESSANSAPSGEQESVPARAEVRAILSRPVGEKLK